MGGPMGDIYVVNTEVEVKEGISEKCTNVRL